MLVHLAPSDDDFELDLLARLPKADREAGNCLTRLDFANLAYSRDFDGRLKDFAEAKWKLYSTESKKSARAKEECKKLFLGAIRGDHTSKGQAVKAKKKLDNIKKQNAEKRAAKASKDAKKAAEKAP